MASLTLAKMIFPVAAGSVSYANLLTPDPKEAFANSSGLDMDFDFGVAVTADTFFVGFVSAASAPTSLNVTPSTGLGTGLGAANALNLGASTEKRRHAFAKIAVPVASRYWRLTFGGAPAFQVAVFGIGKSVQPAWGHEWGAGRFVDDRSAREPLPSGGWGLEQRAIVPGWQFTCGDLTDAELAELWEMAQDVGMSRPVIVAEDPAAAQPALNRGLHYGLFDRPEAYERLLPGASRWSFRVAGWI